MPRSYSIDDKPVKININSNEIVIEGNPEHQNCVLKIITIRKGPDNDSLEVVHEIRNICRWPIQFSCWALTVMRQKGFAVTPIKPKCVDEKRLLPDRSIALWPYTSLLDKRLVLGEKYIFIRQDPETPKPLKIGINGHNPWVAYYVDEHLFIKMTKRGYEHYPDFNSVIEVYTNDRILELETLSPLRIVEPGKSNIHTEIWRLIRIGYIEPREDAVDMILKNMIMPIPIT